MHGVLHVYVKICRYMILHVYVKICKYMILHVSVKICWCVNYIYIASADVFRARDGTNVGSTIFSLCGDPRRMGLRAWVG